MKLRLKRHGVCAAPHSVGSTAEVEAIQLTRRCSAGPVPSSDGWQLATHCGSNSLTPTLTTSRKSARAGGRR